MVFLNAPLCYFPLGPVKIHVDTTHTGIKMLSKRPCPLLDEYFIRAKRCVPRLSNSQPTVNLDASSTWTRLRFPNSTMTKKLSTELELRLEKIYSDFSDEQIRVLYYPSDVGDGEDETEGYGETHPDKDGQTDTIWFWNGGNGTTLF